MTKAKRYERYSSEFKREAILRAGEEGVTDRSVCDELGISKRQFRRWRDELQLLGDDALPGQGRTRDEEMAGLKRELAEAVNVSTPLNIPPFEKAALWPIDQTYVYDTKYSFVSLFLALR